jgi:hypothetical protein
VFQVSPYNAAHRDVVADSANPGPQSTGAAYQQINLYSRLRSRIQSHDDVFIQQSVHLGNNVCRAAMPRMFPFARDQCQAVFCQIDG